MKEFFVKSIAEIFILIIGWFFCLAFLIIAYHIGYWAAPHLGWDGNREILGILSAIALVWLYEHQYFVEKLEKIGNITNPKI